MPRTQKTSDSLPVMAKRLRQARERAEISQKTLGIHAGIDEFSASARVNQYERGKHAPDFLMLERFGEILGVPTEFFYARDDLIAEMLIHFSLLSEKQKLEVITSLSKQKKGKPLA